MWNFFSIFVKAFNMERILSKKLIREFWAKHPDSEQYLKTWYETVVHANWNSPSEIKKTFATASILKNSRVVFNIKGGSYRMIVKFNFQRRWCFIRFLGTHEEYSRIDADKI
jgi:mRNA interferase HigB